MCLISGCSKYLQSLGLKDIFIIICKLLKGEKNHRMYTVISMLLKFLKRLSPSHMKLEILGWLNLIFFFLIHAKLNAFLIFDVRSSTFSPSSAVIGCRPESMRLIGPQSP